MSAEAGAVSVIGLGAMGAALAGALIDADFTVTVWNRSPQKCDALVARGARRAVTTAEAAAASPLTVVCLLDYRAVESTLRDAGGAIADRTLINLTNGAPDDARRLARWVGAQGGAYLDGGIMAVPETIGGQDAFILYSGSASAFRRHQRALEQLGRARFLGSDPGRAALFDLALLAAMYGLFGGFLQAAAMVKAEGAAAIELAELTAPWLDAMAGSLPDMARQIDAHDYAATGSNLAMQAVALDNIIAANAALGLDASLLRALRALMARRLPAGGGEDIAGLVEILLAADPAPN